MKKIIIITLTLILIFTGFSTSQTSAEEKVWKLGDRIIPGPLPPDNTQKAPDLERKPNLSYGEHDKQKLDFYRPKICEGQTLPLAVFIHGGGFTAGDKGGLERKATAVMFSQMGFATASLNYRLCPETKMPAPIEDCKTAIRYLRANADELGIDPSRIAVWGSSAGGHMVNILGTADDDDGLDVGEYLEFSSGVSAVVNLWGTCDFETMFSDVDQERANKKMNGLFGVETLDECRDECRDASPVIYVTSEDPPILTIHGAEDSVVPYSQGTQLAKKIFSVGGNNATIKVKHAGHGIRPVNRDVEIIPSRETTDFQTVAHLARYIEPAVLGDLNLDGKVSIGDAINLAMLYGYQGTDAEGNPAPDFWNPLADIVPDGKIDIDDWELFWELF